MAEEDYKAVMLGVIRKITAQLDKIVEKTGFHEKPTKYTLFQVSFGYQKAPITMIIYPSSIGENHIHLYEFGSDIGWFTEKQIVNNQYAKNLFTSFNENDVRKELDRVKRYVDEYIAKGREEKTEMALSEAAKRKKFDAWRKF